MEPLFFPVEGRPKKTDHKSKLVNDITQVAQQGFAVSHLLAVGLNYFKFKKLLAGGLTLGAVKISVIEKVKDENVNIDNHPQGLQSGRRYSRVLNKQQQRAFQVGSKEEND